MEKYTLTQVQQILRLSEYVYIKNICNNDWELFLDDTGSPFEFLSDAIRYFRNSDLSHSWGYQLSTFAQAQMGNAEWDNL